ncbi:uncharacterized protein LOC126748645 [Anthonomus grandis grandis]|uniref:uncharacterized protein LOC126748645 n=1 Tax=Anthonomus grandis grandis TaxID=2921223 RepID=UPI002165B7CB|nr:uncharacterized protein LOC126748645 [Anthonomus grandis grandis]
MSSEIEVPETPNWLKDLEEKRERRLKARLGHEAGAGAPCLKCEDKCPGLDLHFWRKACKICRCPKEEHDVPDDDVYGWAQFQLLGSKPSKVKTKIVLPGKKDEVELEWAPKGHKETIDKYLKTLPPESLPVKGSQAAQERKQLLQKQIPVHDIDPSLCHELNEEEVKKMEDYIDHVKKSSVGVGQIVNLSSVIKANLHNISPQEAHIIASRYSKGIPFSELVKLQAGLAKNLENLTLNSPKKTPLKEMQPVNPIQQETLQNPLHASKFKDITQPWYSNTSPGKGTTSAQYSENVQRQQKPDYAIDKKLLQGTNFDPSKTPSQFLGYHTPGYRPKDQYGFENPYFNQPKYEEQNPQAPKSVKDLIYSTYDPDKGPVPQDEGSSRSFNPKDSGYNSNLVPNTYKHDPSVFQSMPMDPAKTIPQGIPRFDPLTGKLIKEDHRYPQKISSGPHLPRFDPETGKYIKEDLKYPQNIAGGAIFDPVTGKYLAERLKGPEGALSRVDPITGKLIPGYQSAQMPRYDPKTGKYIEEDARYPQNIAGGAIYDPITGNYLAETREGPGGALSMIDPVTGKLSSGYQSMPRYDPETGKYIEGGSYYPGNMEGGKVIDPVTGQPIPGHHVGQMPRYDPETGKYIEGGSNYPGNMKGGGVIDPVTGQPIPWHHVGQMSRYDPETGKYIQEDPRYPKNILGRTIFDPVTGKYLPDTGAGEYDPITGKPIPGHHFNQLPRFDPETGKYIEDDPRYQQRLADSRVFDPITGKYLSDNERGAELDPITGKPRFDPESGKYLADPKSQEVAKPYNPNTSKYITDDVPLFDPVTGKYIPEDQRLPNSDSKKPSVLESIRRFENAMSPKGLNKLRKPLCDLQPGQINVSEDYLEPHMVNIGAIQDINPEIRAATTKLNPGFEDQNEDNNADYSPDSIREILNNIKLPDCHYCKKPFEENEFAVTIDRANVLFHAQCFKCAGCNQSLADNIYFYYKDTNNVYCGRDYAKIMGYPRCSACDELIFTKEYCLAENSTFHLKHFCCFQCDTPLAGQDYTLEDEKPYCLPCFETSKAAKCSTCENVIKPDEMGCQLNGVHFHAEDRCFRCIVCSVPLMGKKMLLRNEKLYCSHECFNTGKK